MHLLVFLAAADSGGQVEEIAKTFGVDWPHLIAQMISFGIVCLILQRYAYKPVLKTLELRRQQMMAQAGTQANKLIEEARSAAGRVGEQETQKAITAAEQIIAKAREAAEQDYARMLADLKRDVGRLVVQTTAAVAGKVLTPEDHRRLEDETARQLV